MKLPGVIVPIVAGPMLVLTYLLFHGANPDVALHERTLDAAPMVILNDAALQRDALRAGLLRNYDPLVQSVEDLRDAAATLRATAGQAPDDEEYAEIDRRVDDVGRSVANQETIVEEFKSRNALLQNSLSYFNHMIHRHPEGAGERRGVAASVIGALSNAMGRFTSEPRPELAAEITSPSRPVGSSLD